MLDKFNTVKKAVIQHCDKLEFSICEDTNKMQQLKKQNQHPDIIYTKFIRNQNTINQLSKRIENNKSLLNIWQDVLSIVRNIDNTESSSVHSFTTKDKKEIREGNVIVLHKKETNKPEAVGIVCFGEIPSSMSLYVGFYIKWLPVGIITYRNDVLFWLNYETDKEYINWYKSANECPIDINSH